MAADDSTRPEARQPYGQYLATTGSLVFAAATLRTAGRWLDLLADHSQELMDLAAESDDVTETENERERAKMVLRDEVMRVMHEMVEIQSQEARLSVDRFDAVTRAGIDDAEGPARPHKPKS